MTLWWIGVIASGSGSILLNAGHTVIRYSHLREEAREAPPRIVFKQPLWWLGMLLFLVGNILDAVGLTMAPQSVAAPLGSLSIVSNTIFSRLFLKEMLEIWDIFSDLLIIGGAVLIVLFGSHTDTQYTTSELLVRYQAPSFIAFTTCMFGSVLLLYAVIFFVKRVSPKVRAIFLPLGGGLLGSQTVLYFKGAGELLKTSIAGSDQFSQQWLPWIVLIVAGVSATIQIVLLNYSLKTIDASYVVPAWFSAWSSGAIVGGAVFWGEFSSFSALQFGMFFTGLILVLFGIAVLSRRVQKHGVHTARAGAAPQVQIISSNLDSDEEARATLVLSAKNSHTRLPRHWFDNKRLSHSNSAPSVLELDDIEVNSSPTTHSGGSTGGSSSTSSSSDTDAELDIVIHHQQQHQQHTPPPSPIRSMPLMPVRAPDHHSDDLRREVLRTRSSSNH